MQLVMSVDISNNKAHIGRVVPCRLAMTMHRREQALKGLPGPKHPLIFGMMMDLVCRRDPHRYATELAERYGPIFKFRLLIFHVSPATARALHHGTSLSRAHACFAAEGQ